MSIVYPSDIGDFVIGRSPIGLFPSTGWPPGSDVGVTVQEIIKSYAYVEYQDDDAVLAFIEAFNIYAQAYLDYYNDLNLPIYTALSGPLLDWVAAGLYGITRPALQNAVGFPPRGPFATAPFASIPFAFYSSGLAPSYVATNDDVFKRIITWAFYKGDGKVFTARWLKRRINRFLHGANGTDVINPATYGISVTFSGPKAWVITLPTTPMSTIFKEAVEAGVLELPFQITFQITLT